MIRKAQNLYPIESIVLCGPVVNPGDGLFFSMGDTGRRHFDTINLQAVQQCAGDTDLLVRGERDPLGLLTIPERGIH